MNFDHRLPPGEYTPGEYLVPPKRVIPQPGAAVSSPQPQSMDFPNPPKPAADPCGPQIACLKSGEPWMVIRPEWLDSPKDARMLDIRTDAGIVLGPTTTDVQLIRYQVPDRYMGILVDFGHALTNPALFGVVTWRILVNESPLEYYNNFSQQIGAFVQPTKFPSPIIIKYGDIVRVVADNPAALGVNAFARLRGWIFPVEAERLDRFLTV